MSEQGIQQSPNREERVEALREQYGEIADLSVPESPRAPQQGVPVPSWVRLQVIPGRGRQMFPRGFPASRILG